MCDEDRIQDELRSPAMVIKKGKFMFDNIDAFVEQSRENTNVKLLVLYPFDNDAGNYEFWDKVGQIVGNLMNLGSLAIQFQGTRDEARIPDWEILTRILPYLRRKVALRLVTDDDDVEVEVIQGLARAIHGHPMISDFSSETGFTFANLAPWCSALVTLPSLKSVTLGFQEPETEDQGDLVILEPFKDLLRAPALRRVRFDSFYFTNALCHVVASALEEGSSVIDISFDEKCTFPDGGRAIIANALKRNASVTDVKFLDDYDEPFCNTLAAVLRCNTTLQKISLEIPEEEEEGGAGGRSLSSIFLSLGMNTTLKSLSVDIFDKFGGELCAAITSGLAKNSTLEELSLGDMISSDDDGAVSARNALSFLRTNSTLKSLTVMFDLYQKKSYVSAFRLEAVKMMEDNPCLESLKIGNGSKIKIEELFALLSALQRDTTLKTLGFQSGYDRDTSLYLNDDELSQLVSILMKNYGLERVVPDIHCADDRIVKAIFRLNRAGRRYLIKDGSSISKGVEVLSAVSGDINCVFLHLLENPGLCERSAVETTTTTISWQPGANLDESSSSGKRERAQSQPAGKEPRRRLA
jgi:hypothetical protein